MADLEEKQQYLRENIMEKGYDPEEFVEFCETHKGGVNIQDWQFSELIEITNQFLQAQNAPEPHNQFEAFSDFISSEEAPKEEITAPVFDFSQVDLDFFDQMGAKSTNRTTSSTLPVTGNTILIPHDVAEKLEEGGNNFISAYNKEVLEHPKIEAKKPSPYDSDNPYKKSERSPK